MDKLDGVRGSSELIKLGRKASQGHADLKFSHLSRVVAGRPSTRNVMNKMVQ